MCRVLPVVVLLGSSFSSIKSDDINVKAFNVTRRNAVGVIGDGCLGINKIEYRYDVSVTTFRTFQ